MGYYFIDGIHWGHNPLVNHLLRCHRSGDCRKTSGKTWSWLWFSMRFPKVSLRNFRVSCRDFHRTRLCRETIFSIYRGYGARLMEFCPKYRREPQHTPGAYTMNPQTPKWKEPLHKLLENNMAFVFAIFQFHPTCSFADRIWPKLVELSTRWPRRWREALEVHIQVSMEFLEVPLNKVVGCIYNHPNGNIYIYIHLVYNKWCFFLAHWVRKINISPIPPPFLLGKQKQLLTPRLQICPLYIVQKRSRHRWYQTGSLSIGETRVWRLWFRAKSTILISPLWKSGTSSTQNCLFLRG